MLIKRRKLVTFEASMLGYIVLCVSEKHSSCEIDANHAILVKNQNRIKSHEQRIRHKIKIYL